jgi:hypothetical protein
MVREYWILLDLVWMPKNETRGQTKIVDSYLSGLLSIISTLTASKRDFFFALLYVPVFPKFVRIQHTAVPAI